MATYIFFGSYSSDAIKGISGKRTEKARELFQSLGGSLNAVYAVLGAYDLVLIAEVPGIKEAMKASLALNKQSGISFTTMPAVSVEEFDNLAAEI
jgi:uncharacterized protein with GYD domain